MLVFLAVWFGILPATRLQGTVGKRIACIKVATMQGKPIGIAQALVRFVFLLVTVATLGVGFLVAGWTAKRQALHDLVARTLVVQASARPEEITHAVAPPMWWFNRALGVICLAGFLAVMWGSYRVHVDHPLRGQVSAMNNAVKPYRDEVEAALREGKPLPSPSTPSQLPPYVRALSIRADGTVDISVLAEVAPEGRIHWTPQRTQTGQITWKCTAENIRDSRVPNSCRR